MIETIAAFIGNASILLSASLVLDLSNAPFMRAARIGAKIGAGVLLTGLGMAVMLTPWAFAPGIVFDTRSILTSAAGLFFGPIPTCMAMAGLSALRILQGGPGALTGVLVIAATGGIGLLWRWLRARRPERLSVIEYWLFGAAVHVAMLSLMLTLPGDAPVRVLPAIGLPVMLIYPAATAGLCAIMGARMRRENMQVELARSEAALNDAQRTAKLGRWELELRGGRIYWSDTIYDILELDRNDVRASNAAFMSRVHPDDLVEVRSAFSAAIEQGIPYSKDFRLLFPEGRIKWVHETCRIEPDPDGGDARAIGIIQDISNAKRAEEALKEALEEREALYRELQHRVKNSMSLMSALVRLERDRHSDATVRKALDDIHGRVNVMSTLYDMLYKERAGSLRLDRFLGDIAMSVIEAMSTSGIELVLELEEITAKMKQASALGLILNELATNALKYAFEGRDRGRLRVSLAKSGEGAELIVADDGKGYPVGADPFDAPGFGLQVVKLLASQFDGHASYRRAGGSEFSVWIKLDS
jgi:PAS domain S-box-containing protein